MDVLGEEKGSFYAIDLGGTNFRLMHCELGEKQSEVKVEERVEVQVPDYKKKGSCSQLFEFIALSLQEFVAKFPSSGGSQVRCARGKNTIAFQWLHRYWSRTDLTFVQRWFKRNNAVLPIMCEGKSNTGYNRKLIDLCSFKVKVGFCFSFPIRKTAPNCGILLAWTKGYDYTDGVGEDVVQLLQSSFHSIGLDARIYVIMNDSVGVLAGGR